MTLKTIVSYPDRGKWGESSYSGNCSGHLIKDLLEYFQPQKVYDPMTGSGTTGEVCKDLRIECIETDLNPEYGGLDILNEDVPVISDFIFWHPPYFNIYKYSGEEWGTKPNNRDISRTNNYSKFIKQINTIQAKLIRSLRKGGHIAILVGDITKKGVFRSMQKDMQWYGKPRKIIIKAQHNYQSGRKNYSGKYIETVHEFVLVFKRDDCYIISAKVIKALNIDLRETTKLTWKDVVLSALEKLGGQAELKELYQEIKNHKKTRNKRHWKAKIRQVVRDYDNEFRPSSRGVYSLA